MGRKKNIIHTCIFLILMLSIVLNVQSVFKSGLQRAYQAEEGFYREKPNSLDAVYIGASNVHAFWQPPLAWRDHGIAVYSFSIDAMPMQAVKYLMTEARKTQPDALYIVNLNSFKNTEYTDVNIHRVSDYLHFSANKLDMINTMSEEINYDRLDRLEFFMPIIRFHSRWSELSSWDFTPGIGDYKMGLVYKPFLRKVVDVTNSYNISEDIAKPTEDQLSIISDLLQYCDDNNVNVLFVTVPQAIKSDKVCAQMNGIEEYISDRGYKFLDLLADIDSLEIKTDTDFYNKKHTNIHGSIKYTNYLSNYLIDTYGFTDKRGQTGWESWDAAAESYYEDQLARYSLPFEHDHSERDYSLNAPTVKKLKIDGHDITINWTETDGATGYDIFRKRNVAGLWLKAGTVEAGTCEFTEYDMDGGLTYTYVVVPYRMENDIMYYGCFDIFGKKGTIKAEE